MNRLRAILLSLTALSLLPSAGLADPARYQALDARGKPAKPHAGVRPHACVLDTGSGLVWEVKTGGKGTADKDWLYSWYDPSLENQKLPVGYPDSGRCPSRGRCDTQHYVADLNRRGLCGFKDWRVPTAAELEGLLRPDVSVPGEAKIDTTYFPNTPAGYFWTADYVPSEVGGAMLVSFESGLTLEGNSGSGAHLRLVRGPAKR